VISVDQYQLIRHLYSVQGVSKREIARRLNISRNTVKHYCSGDNVPWERAEGSGRPCSAATPEVIKFINDIFESDKKAPKKQRHTAKRIYERLRDEKNYKGSESTIRHLVASMREEPPKQAFIPLRFDPGEAAQVDWGTAKVRIDGVQVEAHLFCMRLCNSCAPFVIAFPSEREEAFIEAHKKAFEFFGGVPKRLIYDNLKTAVKEGWGKKAQTQESFKAFSAHYAYEASFCNPAEGHEKGLVEGLVKYMRLNMLVPIPAMASWEDLNEYLLARCSKYIKEHKVDSHSLRVNDEYYQEKAALTPLPGRPFEAAKIVEAKVSYFCTVRFDTNQYSVPAKWVGYTVTVKASAFTVDIYYRNELIASHKRSYSKDKTFFELGHYIPLLERSPRAARNARPVKEANLPLEFWKLAVKLPNPDKDLVRLLRLVVDNGLTQVMDAISNTLSKGIYSIEAVTAGLMPKPEPVELTQTGPHIQLVDMRMYDELLKEAGCR